MPETSQILFGHKELVELMLKQSAIHEGKWIILAQFALGVGNMGATPAQAAPTVIATLTQIGIQRAPADAPPEMIVDAAKVNPPPAAEGH